MTAMVPKKLNYLSFTFLFLGVFATKVLSFTPYYFERRDLHELWLRQAVVDPFMDYSPIPEEILKNSLHLFGDSVSLQIIKRYPFLFQKKFPINFGLYTSFQSDSVNAFSLFPRLKIKLSSVTLLWEPVLRAGGDNWYPRYSKGAIARLDFDRAYISWEKSGLFMLLGRERVIWGGNPTVPAVFSGASPSFDMFFLSYRRKFNHIGYFHAQYGATQLDSYGEPGSLYKRYLVFHRLDFSPSRFLRIGYAEIALFGGLNRSFELYYLNPWIIYYPYQWNRGRVTSDNYIWIFDGRLTLKKNTLYGALIVDDIQLVPDGEPPHLGLSVSFESADPFSMIGTYLSLSYQAMTSWALTYNNPWERFYYIGFPILHPLGPDFDQLDLDFVWHKSKNFDLMANVQIIRKGENNLFTPWPNKFPSDDFLLGIVEKSYSFNFGVEYFKTIKNGVTSRLCVLLGGTTIHNFNHVIGRKRSFPYLLVRLSSDY